MPEEPDADTYDDVQVVQQPQEPDLYEEARSAVPQSPAYQEQEQELPSNINYFNLIF